MFMALRDMCSFESKVRCIMKTRNSLWTLSPKAMELQPHESAYLPFACSFPTAAGCLLAPKI